MGGGNDLCHLPKPGLGKVMVFLRFNPNAGHNIPLLMESELFQRGREGARRAREGRKSWDGGQ